MNGNGPSGIILDPTKGNVYKIQIQYLGFGNTKYFIEDENIGRFTLVHVLKWVNKNNLPVYTNPAFKPKISAKNKLCLENKSVSTICMSILNEGQIKYKRNTRSFSVTKIGIGPEIINILSLRNKSYFRNNVNINEMKPLFIGISNISAQNSNTTIYIIHSPMNSCGQYVNFKHVAEDSSVMCYALDSIEIPSEYVGQMNKIATYNLGDSNSYTINFDDISIEPNETFAILARTSKFTAELSVSITWIED